MNNINEQFNNGAKLPDVSTSWLIEIHVEHGKELKGKQVLCPVHKDAPIFSLLDVQRILRKLDEKYDKAFYTMLKVWNDCTVEKMNELCELQKKFVKLSEALWNEVKQETGFDLCSRFAPLDDSIFDDLDDILN